MNVQIRRLGIVIKTIPVKGDKARIGSGEDCEISLSDPYLATVVAELVHRDGEWYIVDVGSSLDGVRHGDVKINEELFDPGEAFVIGGFEIVREGAPVVRTTQSRTMVPESIPATMFQAKLEPLPGTVIQSLDEMRGTPKPERPEDTRSRLAFQKLPTAPGAKEQPAAAGPKSRIRLILLAAAVMFGLLFLAVIIGTRSGKKATATPAADTAATAVPVPAPAVPAAAAVPAGDAAALRLDLPNAFAGWEAELKRKDDPALRRKLVSGALEVGRAYAATGDPRAADYLEIVIRNGAAGSAEVATARERLEFIRK